MTAPLWERDDAHALLVSETERARAGSGRLVLLRGATGTGRTAVLEAATAHAADRGLRVLHLRCSPGCAAEPLLSVRQLLCAVPGFADVVPGDADRPDGTALWRLLLSYAADAPLMVAVDDIHLADDSSRRWFAEAARRIDQLPVLLVATERSQYDIDPQPAGLTHALSPSLVRTHTLAPLTDAASAELVRDAFPTAPPQWTADCVRAAAGSPLLLRALLDDLGDPPPATVPRTCAALYPGAYPAAVSWWLDSAGPATTEVARSLAALEQGWDEEGGAFAFGVVGEGAGVGRVSGVVAEGLRGASASALLADVAGADPARVAGWLTAMTRLGVLRPDAVGRPRYAHSLLRDAVLTGCPVARRQEVHRAAAEVMLRRGEGAEAVARQLRGGGVVGLPWALRVLRDAVTAAVRDERPYDAVGHLRRALEEPMPDDLRQRLLTELGSLEYAAADAPVGIPHLAEALRLPAEPQDRVRTAIALGTALAGRGEVRTAVQELRRLEDGLPGHPGLARTVQAASALLSDQDRTVRQEAYRWLSGAAEHSPELVGTAGQALLVRYTATAGVSSAQEAMTQLRALLTEPADPLAEPFLLGTAAAVAQWADELDEADTLVELGLAGQRPPVLHPMERSLLDVRIDIVAARGQYGRLLAEHLTRATPATPATPETRANWTTWAAPARGPGPTNTDAHLVIALIETGRMADARRLADSFDLGQAPDSWELNRFLFARGVLHYLEGDVTAALHDFLECGRRQSARAVVNPIVTPWRTAAAECLLAQGRRPEAVALAEEELRLARVWNTPRTVGRALRILARMAGGRRGLELAEEAVRVLRQSPAEFDMATALLAQGRQLVTAGERARGRGHMREAAERAERLGAVRLRSHAEEALRAGGARRFASALTGSGSLTVSERRIAELAAAGRTNTEIANLLQVARRTVETHLTSTYRKLGIRRRGELRGVLEAEG
ncbi:LuxR C-terminal-related transcriptional regulator [Streptomyces sp. NPDC050619]|uniref:LuxR C-terminal-related transcriptional regulator n=1 Tax=Streptomyces sp. NPDC050619 TaxID=3157214 RepID=UPI00343A86BE